MIVFLVATRIENRFEESKSAPVLMYYKASPICVYEWVCVSNYLSHSWIVCVTRYVGLYHPLCNKGSCTNISSAIFIKVFKVCCIVSSHQVYACKRH